MRRTRFMTLMFLGLSVAFLGVEDFRWALEAPLIEMGLVRSPGTAGALEPDELRRWAQAAEASGDTLTMAFVALHLPPEDKEGIEALAERVVARDSKLTWIYYPVANRLRQDWKDAQTAARLEKWAAALQAADPNNAMPWLWHGELIRARATDWGAGALITPGSPYLESLTARTEWRAAMSQAIRKPVYDSYTLRLFGLDREVLIRQDRATPAALLVSMVTYPIPNLLNVREYAGYEVNLLAVKAQQANRMEEALGYYRDVRRFAHRMRLDSKTLIEQLIAGSIERLAGEPLLAALKKAGAQQEAAAVELTLEDIARARVLHLGEDPIALSSSHYWSALVLHLFAGLSALFGVLTVLCVLYVNAKIFIRPEKRGRLYNLMTIAENYTPVLLFFCSLGLYVTYAPYAYNFRYYLRATGKIQNLEPFFFNVFPSWIILPRSHYLPIEGPFLDYLPWALAALIVVVILGGWQEWHLRRQGR